MKIYFIFFILPLIFSYDGKDYDVKSGETIIIS